VELAFPWKVLREYAHRPAPPREGDQWRINFSRVEWQIRIANGKYQKVPKTPEDNWVWSPQGIIDMHRPEKWGFVQFTTKAPGTVSFAPDPSLPARSALQEIYYAQRDYETLHHHWAERLEELNLAHDFDKALGKAPSLNTTLQGFEATAEIDLAKEKTQRWHIREDGKVWTD
jgi:hypothetical protein